MKIKTTILVSLFIILSIATYSQEITTVYEFPNIGLNDVSSDGNWACGSDGANAYLWSESTGMIFLGQGFAYGVSNTGRVVGESKMDTSLILPNGTPVPVACYWDSDGTYHSLGKFMNVEPYDPSIYSSAQAISDDGTIIAGMGSYPNYTVEAFTWTADSGYALLGQMGAQGTKATNISGDGNVIGGWGTDNNYQRLPIIWNPTAYMIPSFGPYDGGEVEALNYDGSIAYGEAFGTLAYVPFYWTEATGTINLTNINIQNPAYAFDGNSDASRIVGRIGAFPGQGYIWENTIGQNIKDWVVAHGGQISNEFTVFNANGISSDGNTICGLGQLPTTLYSGFLIKIEPPVPVELTSFTATIVDNSVNLKWTTATENNNSGFEVQRRIGNQNWEILGFVAGRGTTTESSSYSYSDHVKVSEVYSYRLKQIDYEGKYEYSNEINLEFSLPFEFNLAQNYPNPFNPSTTISFSIAQNSNVKLSVFNVLGEEVASLVNEVKNSGTYEVKFDGSNLTSGFYIYTLKAGSMKSSKKMILIK